MSKPIITTAWCAVRHSSDGKDYFEYSSMACLPELADAKSKELDRQIPAWAAGNKFIRVAHVEIREL